MKSIYKVLQSSYLMLLLSWSCINPFALVAQISNDASKGDKISQTNKVLSGNPIVIFKIQGNFSASFFENHFFIDLPAGAALQHNGDGIFQINNMPDIQGQYSIKMRTGGNILNGVTTADISLIQRHILGNGALQGELKLIAADVNCDGKISARDMVDIRRAILGKTDKFDCDTNFTFYPNSLDFEWTGNTIDLGVFIPIKLGDVNGSAAYNSESTVNNSDN